MKKIYPIDWKRTHPNKMATATDQYYAKIANKVLDVLNHSGIASFFPIKESLSDVAIRMTAWFEDLCSELGFWRTVNETCQKRYGKPLPFYDTEDYFAGEPNLQDVRLLLWDFVQSWNLDQIINPENPSIHKVAEEIFKIFDDEFEYAPETEEMTAYLTRPELGTNYWETRRAIEWFALNSYLSLRGRILLIETLLDNQDDETSDIINYATTLAHVLTDSHNLLAMTAAEWLSSVTGRPFRLDTSRISNRYYTIEECLPTGLQIKDLASNDKFMVAADSFDAQWFKKYGNQKGQTLYCGIVGFNGIYQQCGAMVTSPEPKRAEKDIAAIRQQDYAKSLTKANEELFYKASKGKHIVFLKGAEALDEFYSKDMGVPISEQIKEQLKDTIDEQTEDGMVALMATPDQGLLTITLDIPAIKSPDNPFYDAEYAKKYAHNLLVCPDAIDYSAACLLLREGYLSDAALSSLSGYEHGRKLLQDNAQFLMDYMFAEHQ